MEQKAGKNKLCRKNGESLIETIAAMLIAALASVMLAGAIYSASISVDKSRAYIDSYYSENEESEGVILQDEEKGQSARVRITDQSGTLFLPDVHIRYYTNAIDPDNTVIAYHAAP